MEIIDWKLIDYKTAWEQQEAFFNAIMEAKKEKRDTRGMEHLIFCEHRHVYTLGRQGNPHNLLINDEFLKKIEAVFYHIDRGGDITYHGPGQLVGYPILDLENHHFSLKGYIYNMEEAIIRTLSDYGIVSERLEGATGVWIDSHSTRARKICAIGVRASRFVTMHGFALNVNTDLNYYQYINPCGFVDKGVTSIQKEIGAKVDLEGVKKKLTTCLMALFE